MASAVFGAKLRTWMSKMRGSSSPNNGNNSKDSSPTKENQHDYDFEPGCAGAGGDGAVSFFGRPHLGSGNKLPSKKSRSSNKRRKLNCMTVSSSQSFDRIRQQLYEEEYGHLDSPNGNGVGVGRGGAGAGGGCSTAPWDPRVPPYHPQFPQTPARMDVTNRRVFQAPRSVSLSSPESAYGSGNSEDSLTPASSTHPDLHHHQFPGRQYLLSSGQSSYSSLRQHSNPSVANAGNTGSCNNNSGAGSTRSVDRPKIKTNPWVSFQRQLQMQQQQQRPPAQQHQSLNLKPNNQQDQGPQGGGKPGPSVARTQSLSLRDKPASQAKRAQSFRSPLFAANQSALKRISSESESDWDEEEEREGRKADKGSGREEEEEEEEDPRLDNGTSSSVDAVCGSSKMKSLTASACSASPMKSLTFAGEKGFMMQFAKYNPKAVMFMRPDAAGRRGGAIGKTVNCPNCFLMSRHHLGRKHRCQPKPALDAQLCAYCRSWILDEEDSSTDVDTDSDFNETGSTSSSSSSSPVGAGRSKKRLPLSSYHSYFGAAARRRRWRKTLPAPSKNLSRELSTSCSSFLFEGDFGEDSGKAKKQRAANENNNNNNVASKQVGKQTRAESSSDSGDDDDVVSPPSSGNGNRTARLAVNPANNKDHSPRVVHSRSALSTPMRDRDPYWKRQVLEKPESCVTRYEDPSSLSIEDPIGYKTLLTSMEALMAKFGDPASPAIKPGPVGCGSVRPKSSETILDSFESDMPWCTSTPQEQRFSQPESSMNSLNQRFSSRSSLGLTGNGSSCDTLTELPQSMNDAGSGAANRKSKAYLLDSANGNGGNSVLDTDWANGNGPAAVLLRELSPMKDLSSPMSSVETGSAVSYGRKPADFRARYTEEPLVKCRVEEEIEDPLESLHLHPHHHHVLLQGGQTEDPCGGSAGDRRSFNSLEEKLKKLRQERMLLEAKIREARDEDRRRRKEKTSL